MPVLLLVSVSPGTNRDGGKPNASPRGFGSATFDRLEGSLKLPPLHDNVRREWGLTEL